MKMLIEAKHVEETRVVVLNGQKIEEYDYETSTKKSIKGNIYLARVIRVESGLQAAFVEFKDQNNDKRHGFLAFSEIHPDYYTLPGTSEGKESKDDIMDLPVAIEPSAEVLSAESSVDFVAREFFEEGGATDEDVAEVVDEIIKSRPKLTRVRYKIQDVIQRKQVMLVQVMKDERGTKGAALTTYISLPGRYCIFLPNTPKGTGVSRKITSTKERQKLRAIIDDLNISDAMGVIIRTAGAERSKAEIKRDVDYVMRVWQDIQAKAQQLQAPCLVYEEHDLISKAVRDLYTRDVEEIWVEGEEGYKRAKACMTMLMPSHRKKVQHYRDSAVSLFQKYDVEHQLDAIHHVMVSLPSGGHLIFNSTEALVAIDVNSGKSTREKHLEDTALKTNIEAAYEIPRQLRLRDLAGLIVIDFIDMNNEKQRHTVERKLREALKKDRARVQVGGISQFGLLELSRQRLRPSLLESHTSPCPFCRGLGFVRSVESAALKALRDIEHHGLNAVGQDVVVHLPLAVVLYLFNNKRGMLAEVEKRFKWTLRLYPDDTLCLGESRFEGLPEVPVVPVVANVPQSAEALTGETELLSAHAEQADAKPTAGRKRRKSGKKPSFNGGAELATESTVTKKVLSPEGLETIRPGREGMLLKKDLKEPVSSKEPPEELPSGRAPIQDKKRQRSRRRRPGRGGNGGHTSVFVTSVQDKPVPSSSHLSGAEEFKSEEQKGQPRRRLRRGALKTKGGRKEEGRSQEGKLESSKIARDDASLAPSHKVESSKDQKAWWQRLWPRQ